MMGYEKMLRFHKLNKYCERRIAITKNNISVVLQTEDTYEDLNYLVNKAFEIFKREEIR